MLPENLASGLLLLLLTLRLRFLAAEGETLDIDSLIRNASTPGRAAVAAASSPDDGSAAESTAGHMAESKEESTGASAMSDTAALGEVPAKLECPPDVMASLAALPGRPTMQRAGTSLPACCPRILPVGSCCCC